MRRALALILTCGSASAMAACGGSYSTDVVPGLPGDGTANLSAPVEPASRSVKGDPWAGREDLIAAPEATTPVAVAMPGIDRFLLSSGLPVVLVRAPGAGAINVQLAIRSGERDVPRAKAGMATLTAMLLTRGTRAKNARAIQDAADLAGAALGASASYEVTRISCAGAVRALTACARLVGELTIGPTFPAKDVTEVQHDLVASAKQQRADPNVLAGLHFQHFLFGDEHPRGWPMGEASLSNIARADLVAWHKARFRPNNALLVVAADVEPARLKQDLEQAFRGWTKAALPKNEPLPALRTSGIRVRLIDQAGTAAHVRVGHAGLSHDAKDYFAAIVMNRLLGEGSGSRLAGAVAGGNASSSFDRNADRGAFLAGASAKPAAAVSTARTLIGELRRLSEEGPTDAEVERAIAGLIGSYLVRLDSPQAFADALLAVQVHGFDDSYVRDYALQLGKVTRESVAAAARTRLDPANVVVVIVGPANVIEPKLAEAGWVYEKLSPGDPIGTFEKQRTQEGQKDAVAILDKALAAKGGFDRLSKVKTFVWEGTAELTIGAQKAPAKVNKTFVVPDKLRLDMNINGGQLKASTVFDGATGWALQQPKGAAAQSVNLPKAEIELGKAQMWRDQDFVLLRQKVEGARTRQLPDRKVGGAAHHAIEITSKDGQTAVVLLIDKKTHLLAGMDFSEQGLDVKERYSDYKAVDGIQVAHKRSTDSETLKLETKMTKAAFDSKVDPKHFARPKP